MENEKYISRNMMNELIKGNNVRDEELDDFFSEFTKEGYIIEGFNEPKPTLIQEAGKAISNIATDISNRKGEVKQQLSGENNTNPIVAGTQAAATVAGGVGNALNETYKVLTPQPLQNITNKVSEVVSTGFNKAVDTLSNTDLIKEASQYPEQTKGLEQILGIGSNLGDVANNILAVDGLKGSIKTTAQATKAGVKGAVNVAEDVAKGTKTNLVKLKDTLPLVKDVTPEQAIKSVKENLLSQIEGKKSLSTKLDKTRSDVLDTISADPRYHPDIDVENRTFDTKNAVQVANTDIKEYSQLLESLFAKADETQGFAPLNNLEQNVASTLLNPKNKSTYVVAGESVFSDVGKMLTRARRVYGNEVPRQEIWNIRKQIDQNIEKISDTDIKKNLRLDVRKAFANTLEDSVVGSPVQRNLVKNAMDDLSKVIEARDYLEVLNASKIQGGKLTDIIRNATVSSLGQSIGAGAGGLVGGVGGAVAGYAGSKVIGNWLARNTLSTAMERKALTKYITEQPNSFKEISKFVNDLPADEASMLKENLQKLLKAPEITPDTRTIIDKIIQPIVKTIEKGIKDFEQMPNKQGGFINPKAMAEDLGNKSLVQEAKKYKSVEEFVKAQGKPVYHGTNKNFHSFDISKKGSTQGFEESGMFFTDNLEKAKTYNADYIQKPKYSMTPEEINKNSKLNVIYSYIDTDGFITMSDLIKMYENGIIKTKPDFSNSFRPESFFDNNRQSIKEAVKNGVKGIKHTSEGETVYMVADVNKIKTKSQLEQIWKEAQKK